MATKIWDSPKLFSWRRPRTGKWVPSLNTLASPIFMCNIKGVESVTLWSTFQLWNSMVLNYSPELQIPAKFIIRQNCSKSHIWLMKTFSISMCLFFSFLHPASSPKCTSLLLVTIAPTMCCEPNKINVLLWQRNALFFLARCQPSFHTLPHHAINCELYLHLEKTLGN